MSGLFSQFKMDSSKEANGIAVEFPEAENKDGTVPTFYVSRMGKSNKAYSKALEAATRPHRRAIELNTMKNDVADEIMMNVFCNTVLKGWSNIKDIEGKEIAFSKDAAIELFNSLPEVYERLQEEAKLASNFREASLESEAKN